MNLWNRWRRPNRQSRAREEPHLDSYVPELDPEVDDSVPKSGLHAITAPLDHWFGLSVHHLEREARESAEEWAKAGLPRADVASDEELPVETALRKRANEIFTEWVQKVSTRVQDAIESHAQRAREALIGVRFNLDQAERARGTTAEARAEIETLQQADVGRQSSFGFRSYWGGFGYWAAITLLVLVDWVANVPVFQELLPQDAAAEGAWQQMAADAELRGNFGGLVRVWYRVLFAPDVAILALGVIIFLVVLAHMVGISARRILALRTDDVPEANRSVRQYRRQFWVPLGASLVGGVLVILFLYQARETIERLAAERRATVVAEIQQLDRELSEARERNDMEAVASLAQARPSREAELRLREERAAYAERIAATNTPIAILNTVLFLTAALLGYLKAKDNVVAKDPEDPRVADARNRLVEHERLERSSIESAHELAKNIDRELTSAEFLVSARPFEHWEGRRDRLGRAIELFRSENARLRGIDPANVAAFRERPAFSVAVPEAHNRFRLPADFDEIKQAHQQLTAVWRSGHETRV
ncbi:MAG: hypothetical protein ACRELD_13360 [Longimicrobiales bacterium]